MSPLVRVVKRNSRVYRTKNYFCSCLFTLQIRLIFNMSTMFQKIKAIIDWCMALYNKAFENVLSIRAMHTCYDDPDKFIDLMNERYFHFSEAQLAEAKESCPLQVAGGAIVTKVARKRIHLHALHAACATMLCALPTNWIMWPLMIVDMVYFQVQIFAISQELYILYRPKAEYSEMKFDYNTLANVAVKMQGTMLKHKVIKQAKKSVGKIGKWLIKKGVRFLRGPVQALMRQILKWFGITLTKDVVETSLNLLMALGCATVAGLISYWLFVPMAKRLENELIDSK